MLFLLWAWMQAVSSIDPVYHPCFLPLLSSPAGLALDVVGSGCCCCLGRCGICDFNPHPFPALPRPVRGQPEEMPDSCLERREEKRGSRQQRRWSCGVLGDLFLRLVCVNFINDVAAHGAVRLSIIWAQDFPFSQGPQVWMGCSRGFDVAGVTCWDVNWESGFYHNVSRKLVGCFFFSFFF